MNEWRRTVRATPDFFTGLDRQLGPDRGPRGEPLRGDFQAYELLRIVERFATGFDDLPEWIPGRPDGAVELVQLDIDLEWLTNPEAETDSDS